MKRFCFEQLLIYLNVRVTKRDKAREIFCVWFAPYLDAMARVRLG